MNEKLNTPATLPGSKDPHSTDPSTALLELLAASETMSSETYSHCIETLCAQQRALIDLWIDTIRELPFSQETFAYMTKRTKAIVAWGQTVKKTTRDIITDSDELNADACDEAVSHATRMLMFELLFGVERIVVDRKPKARSAHGLEVNKYNKFSSSLQRATIEALLEHKENFASMKGALDQIAHARLTHEAYDAFITGVIGAAEAVEMFTERGYDVAVAPGCMDAQEQTDLVLIPHTIDEALRDQIRTTLDDDRSLGNSLRDLLAEQPEVFTQLTRVQVKSHHELSPMYDFLRTRGSEFGLSTQAPTYQECFEAVGRAVKETGEALDTTRDPLDASTHLTISKGVHRRTFAPGPLFFAEAHFDRERFSTESAAVGGYHGPSSWPQALPQQDIAAGFVKDRNDMHALTLPYCTKAGQMGGCGVFIEVGNMSGANHGTTSPKRSK